MNAPTRCGFAAIMGAPNAGKSTLLNRFAGAKLSIVSPKAQTTRFRVLGIVMRDLPGGGRAQLLLVDTPGIFRPRRRLDRAMVAAAWGGGGDADIVLFVADAKAGLNDATRAVAAELARRGGKAWLVLNKTDLVAPQKLLPLIAGLNEIVPFAETFMVSAATGEGVDELLDRLAAALPEGPFLYPEDELTDLPDRLLAAELVREQVFLRVQQEVPYGVTTETENWLERPDGSVRVEVTIYVARAGQKSILIGAGGQMVRGIGAAARAQLASLLGRPVHLFLNVKDRPGWDEETARLRALGLEDEG
jgi:GTPase